MNQLARALLMVTAGLMAAGLLAAQMHAQSFILSQNGKSVGSASLAIKLANGGFASTSGAQVDMPGLKYSFSENETLNARYQVQSVKLTGSVNGTSATVTGTHVGTGGARQFDLKINANGKVTDSPLESHPLAVFYPDFDPAALQILLDLGQANNDRDLWVVIPKQSGSVAPLRIATKPDESGTLDGKQIVVHHLTVTGPAETTELFSSPNNQLLQAEWTDEGFAMVRNGFVIKPPARAPAPLKPRLRNPGSQMKLCAKAPIPVRGS